MSYHLIPIIKNGVKLGELVEAAATFYSVQHARTRVNGLLLLKVFVESSDKTYQISIENLKDFQNLMQREWLLTTKQLRCQNLTNQDDPTTMLKYYHSYCQKYTEESSHETLALQERQVLYNLNLKM